jgi:hypothetical protein
VAARGAGLSKATASVGSAKRGDRRTTHSAQFFINRSDAYPYGVSAGDGGSRCAPDCTALRLVLVPHLAASVPVLAVSVPLLEVCGQPPAAIKYWLNTVSFWQSWRYRGFGVESVTVQGAIVISTKKSSFAAAQQLG